jgi:O-antigen/teichoic acid export membrane protein
MSAAVGREYVTANRIAAILVGLATMFSLERWGRFQWYLALALGALGYGCVRYAGYFVRKRRHIKRTMPRRKKRLGADNRAEFQT